MDVVFLGINDVGMKIYEWLCKREKVHVNALLTTKDQLNLIKEIRPDLVVSVGYDHLVPPEILEIPQEGCINLHPAYLPYNRGKSPNVWSIIENTPAGVTLHYMTEEFDSGDIISRQKVEKNFDDTGRDLHKRLETAQFNLFTDVWPSIESGTINTTSQLSNHGSYHSVKDFQELCEIDPHERYEVKELLDNLRALTFPPFNNAYIELGGERFYIDITIRHEDDAEDKAPDGFLSSY